MAVAVAVSVLVVFELEGDGKVVGVRWVVGFWFGKHILQNLDVLQQCLYRRLGGFFSGSDLGSAGRWLNMRI